MAPILIVSRNLIQLAQNLHGGCEILYFRAQKRVFHLFSARSTMGYDFAEFS